MSLLSGYNLHIFGDKYAKMKEILINKRENLHKGRVDIPNCIGSQNYSDFFYKVFLTKNYIL